MQVLRKNSFISVLLLLWLGSGVVQRPRYIEAECESFPVIQTGSCKSYFLKYFSVIKHFYVRFAFVLFVFFFCLCLIFFGLHWICSFNELLTIDLLSACSYCIMLEVQESCTCLWKFSFVKVYLSHASTSLQFICKLFPLNSYVNWICTFFFSCLFITFQNLTG